MDVWPWSGQLQVPSLLNVKIRLIFMGHFLKFAFSLVSNTSLIDFLQLWPSCQIGSFNKQKTRPPLEQKWAPVLEKKSVFGTNTLRNPEKIRFSMASKGLDNSCLKFTSQEIISAICGSHVIEKTRKMGDLERESGKWMKLREFVVVTNLAEKQIYKIKKKFSTS